MIQGRRGAECAATLPEGSITIHRIRVRIRFWFFGRPFRALEVKAPAGRSPGVDGQPLQVEADYWTVRRIQGEE